MILIKNFGFLFYNVLLSKIKFNFSGRIPTSESTSVRNSLHLNSYKFNYVLKLLLNFFKIFF